jgi:osmotically-inducible protein OsmY
MRSNADDSDTYLIGHLREALAGQGELHVEVTVSGSRIVLGGHVATEERRMQVEMLVRDAATDHEVHNQVTVAAPEGPPRVEELS